MPEDKLVEIEKSFQHMKEGNMNAMIEAVDHEIARQTREGAPIVNESLKQSADQGGEGEHVWLSERFERALQYASVIHAGQFRKSTGIPYISHLLGVASIALEYGADEDEAIAALLHDAGEDAGGENRVADIRVRFGDRVAKIVEGCSDTLISPKPEWRERKEKYIAHLDPADASTILVSASDKLYNARAILSDLRRDGDTVFDRFNGKKDGTLRYYRALVTAFRKHGDSELLDELDRVVCEIETLAQL
jgi:(p)ppGpp synthase/HD superfamily hydrolase